MELHVLNDPDLCFKDIMRRHLNGEPLLDLAALEEYEKSAPSVNNDETNSKSNGEVTIEEEKDADEVKADDESKEKSEKNKEKLADEAATGDSKEDSKDDSKKESKDDTKADSKDEIKDDSKKDSKEEAKEDTKEDSKEDSKVEAKENSKEESKEESKKDSDSETKDEKSKDESTKQDPKEDEKMDTQTDSKNESSDDSEEKKSEKDKSNHDGKETRNGESEEKKKEVNGESNGKKEPEKSSAVSVTITPKEVRKPRPPPPASTSIVAPTITVQQMEQMAKGGVYDLEMMNDLMAQTYAAAIKWPKDRVLATRLEQVVKCIESGEWNVPEDFSLANELMDTPPSGTPAELRDTATPMSDSGSISEISNDEGVTFNSRKSRRRGLDAAAAAELEKSSKIRSLLTGGSKDDLR